MFQPVVSVFQRRCNSNRSFTFVRSFLYNEASMLLDSRSRRYGVSGGADGGPGASPAGEGRRK